MDQTIQDFLLGFATELDNLAKALGVPVSKTMYCVSCRAKKEPVNVQAVQMKNGRPATKANCPDCGTGMYRIGAAS